MNEARNERGSVTVALPRSLSNQVLARLIELHNPCECSCHDAEDETPIKCSDGATNGG
jgi:hypothetical protein